MTISVVSVMSFAGPGQWMIISSTLFVSSDLENRAKALYPTAKQLDPIDAYNKALAADSFLKAKWRWSKNEKNN